MILERIFWLFLWYFLATALLARSFAQQQTQQKIEDDIQEASEGLKGIRMFLTKVLAKFRHLRKYATAFCNLCSTFADVFLIFQMTSVK